MALTLRPREAKREGIRMTRHATMRDAAYKGPERDAEGRRLCRWCGHLVPRRRRTWCSQSCVDDYKVRSGGAWMREIIYLRDAGVCALCDLDTERLGRIIRHAKARLLNYDEALAALDPWRRCYPRIIPDLPPHRRSLWDVDHKLPVILGGGGCGAENLRTLCWRCHCAETKKLAAVLAKQRRNAKGEK